MTKLCFDYDPLLYSAAAIGEERKVKVIHKTSGNEIEFATRTAFYGHWKTKKGGWLAEANAPRIKAGKEPWTADDFLYEDIQVPEPIEFCIKTLKRTIEAVKEYTGTNSYFGYSGKGTVFREGVSTVIKYKGNRDNVLKPIHLDDLKEYLVRQHNCQIVTNPDPDKNVEADDMCSIVTYDAWKKWEKTKADADKLILCAVDKDYLQCAAHIIHPFDLGEINSHDGSFGFLKVDESGKEKKVIGRGRIWLYFQVMNGDDADNYFANSGNPAVKWGQMSACKTLKDAKTDKEAFEALVRGYKVLYPQPKKITGWRGNEIEVDWLYMLQENFTLAFMLRRLDDKVDVKSVLNKLGVEH